MRDATLWGSVERGQQVEAAQDADQRDQLHRLASLDPLERRAADTGGLGELGLRDVAGQPLPGQALAQLGEHGVVGEEGVEMHRF